MAFISIRKKTTSPAFREAANERLVTLLGDPLNNLAEGFINRSNRTA